MKLYNVCQTFPGNDGLPRFYVQGYPTGRSSTCIETRATNDKAEAERWAEAMNRGETVPEAQACSYADD